MFKPGELVEIQNSLSSDGHDIYGSYGLQINGLFLYIAPETIGVVIEDAKNKYGQYWYKILVNNKLLIVHDIFLRQFNG